MRFAVVAAISAVAIPAVAFTTGKVILTFLLGAGVVAVLVVTILARELAAGDEPEDDEAQMEMFHAHSEAGNGGFKVP